GIRVGNQPQARRISYSLVPVPHSLLRYNKQFTTHIMQPGVLRALEFDRIVEVVQSFALTPMGEARLARLAPAVELPLAADLLAATSETVRYLGSNSLFPLRASSELPDVLTALAVE